MTVRGVLLAGFTSTALPASNAGVEAGGHAGVVTRHRLEEPDLEARLPGNLPLLPGEELVEAGQGGGAVGSLGQDGGPLGRVADFTARGVGGNQ